MFREEDEVAMQMDGCVYGSFGWRPWQPRSKSVKFGAMAWREGLYICGIWWREQRLSFGGKLGFCGNSCFQFSACCGFYVNLIRLSIFFLVLSLIRLSNKNFEECLLAID